MPEVRQSRQPLIGLEDYVTAVATITAVRTAARHELLTAKADCAITTRSRSNVYLD
jgi:hypothetical protein